MKGIPVGHALLFCLAVAARRRALAGISGLAAALCLSACTAPGSYQASSPGGPSIRVCLSDRLQTQTIRVIGQTVFLAGQAKKYVRDSATVFARIDSQGQMHVRIGSETAVAVDGSGRFYSAEGTSRFVHAGRQYSDTLVLAADGGRIAIINILPIETYLLSVVPNEIGRNRTPEDMEAVKAQAIVARTYALAKIQLPLTRLFDVHDDSRDQVFTGTEAPGTVTARAVSATAGEVLEYDGRPAECYFHSACGGRTEAVAHVWRRPQSKPYLAGVVDGERGREFCRIAPSFRWTEEYSRTEFEAMLREHSGSAIDTLRRDSWSLLDVKIQKRMPSGRVAVLKILIGDRTHHQSVFLEADRIRWSIRRAHDQSVFRSTLFDVKLERDDRQWITRLRFHGAGSGHGIGMCQWGAIGRSRKGYTARRILQAYFPGTDIARRY